MKTQVINVFWKTFLLLSKGRLLFLITLLSGFIYIKANNPGGEISEPAKISDNEKVGMYIAEGANIYVAEGSFIKADIHIIKSKNRTATISSKRTKKVSTPKVNKLSARKTISKEQPIDKVPVRIDNIPKDSKSFFTNTIFNKTYGLQVSISMITLLVIALYRLMILPAVILAAFFLHHNYLSERLLSGNFQRPPPTE